MLSGAGVKVAAAGSCFISSLVSSFTGSLSVSVDGLSLLDSVVLEEPRRAALLWARRFARFWDFFCFLVRGGLLSRVGDAMPSGFSGADFALLSSVVAGGSGDGVFLVGSSERSKDDSDVFRTFGALVRTPSRIPGDSLDGERDFR